MAYDRELDAALRLGVQAGAVALHFQQRGLQVETKPDDSPVTAADRESERLIAAGLAEAFPEDGLLGEEGANKAGSSGRKWIVDPIDGTRDFVRGHSHWAVFLALEDRGEVVLGVVAMPALGHTYWAVKGGGAFRNGSPIRVSEVREPSRAMLCLNGLNKFAHLPRAAEVLPWTANFWTVRSFGGCLDAMLVAAGKADAWVEPSLQPWDMAAPRIIGEEAGAVFRNFDGGASIYGKDCILANPALAERIARFFAP